MTEENKREEQQPEGDGGLQKAYVDTQETIEKELESLDRYAVASFVAIAGAIVARARTEVFEDLSSISLMFVIAAVTGYVLQIIFTVFSHMLSVKTAEWLAERLYVKNCETAGREKIRYEKVKYGTVKCEAVKHNELCLEVLNTINPWLFIAATASLYFGFLASLPTPLTLLTAVATGLIVLVTVCVVRSRVAKSGLPLQKDDYFEYLWKDDGAKED